uniref:WEE1 homolog 2 (S. pombe) n=1 Tax=Cyprinus carpio TaxID=7962 RepID=A0A8C2AE85_CYPCA
WWLKSQRCVNSTNQHAQRPSPFNLHVSCHTITNSHRLYKNRSHRTRSITVSPSNPTSPILYAAWKKLWLCYLLPLPCSSSKPCRSQRFLRLSTAFDPVLSVNVNPFTPETVCRNSEHHKRKSQRREDDAQKTQNSSEGEYFFLPSKRPAVSAHMLSHFESEFLELGCIGVGEFGSVYRCVKRLNGCMYAIKRSRRPIAGSANDVCHAVLGHHPHVVRYYSAWAEDDHMIKHIEFCDGGSLHDAITEKGEQGEILSVPELRDLLLQVSLGLKYIHSSGLMHLNIKPSELGVYFIVSQMLITLSGTGLFDWRMFKFLSFLGNIFICCRPSSSAGGERESEEDETYLIIDVLFVILTCIAKMMDIQYLYICDIMNILFFRPSASALCRHDVLKERAGKLAAQLCKELNVEKFRTAVEQELKEAQRAATSPQQAGRKLVGRSAVRSMSFGFPGY